MSKKDKKAKKQAKKQAKAMLKMLQQAEIITVDPMQAAKITVGLLTAGRAVHAAHDDGVDDCSPHHDSVSLLVQDAVEDPITASLVIRYLTEVASQFLSEEDLRDFAMTVARSSADLDDNH